MLIGAIADTHDNLEAIEKAVEVFNKLNISLVLHAGDWNAPFTSIKFSRLKAKLIGVYGNVDGEREMLKKRYEEMGADIKGEFAELDIEGVRIALTHGVNERIIEALAKSKLYDLIIRGHTHKPEVKTINETKIINPGEACGYITSKRTIATIDTSTLEAKILEIN